MKWMATKTCLLGILFKRYQLRTSLYFDFNEGVCINKNKAQIFNVI